MLVAAAIPMSQAWVLTNFAPSTGGCFGQPQSALSGHGDSACLQIEQIGYIDLLNSNNEDCNYELYTTRNCGGHPEAIGEDLQCVSNTRGLYKSLRVRVF